MKTVFRRIGGRIIPIIEKHPMASGAAIVVGSSIAASALRRQIAQKTRGKGKMGFGNPLANFGADISISAGLVYGAQKIGGAPVSKSLQAFSALIKRSVRGY